MNLSGELVTQHQEAEKALVPLAAGHQGGGPRLKHHPFLPRPLNLQWQREFIWPVAVVTSRVQEQQRQWSQGCWRLPNDGHRGVPATCRVQCPAVAAVPFPQTITKQKLCF